MKVICASIDVSHYTDGDDDPTQSPQEEFSLSLTKTIDDTESTADAAKSLMEELHRRLNFVNARKTN